MSNWEIETKPYIRRLKALLKISINDLARPAIMQPLPASEPLPATAPIAYRAYAFYREGSILRVRELLESIIHLTRNGYVPSASPLVRLTFEVWAVTHVLTEALASLHRLIQDKCQDEERFKAELRKLNRVFEGVKTPVLLPWGTEAAEVPIHILDAIKQLQDIWPQAMEDYKFLCEAAHPNFPRYMEWHAAGKIGDNWSNNVAAERCHKLMERTFQLLENAVKGCTSAAQKGTDICAEIYAVGIEASV